MTTATDDDIAEMLRDGATYNQIRTTLHVSPKRISAVRQSEAIPIPAGRSGGGARDPEDAVSRRIEPYGEGHARWTGPRAESGHPVVWIGPSNRKLSVARLAFRAHHGREPVGQVRVGCTEPGCIAGAHLADRIIRTADAVLAEILGSSQ